MIRIAFACGHRVQADEFGQAPVCACGERRIQSVVTDRAPRFRGFATGPCAVQETAAPAAVVIKESAHG